MDLTDLEVAPLEVVHQAARDFAAALAATPAFRAFEAAGEKVEHDPAAQAAINAFQAKQAELKMMQSLQAITPAQQEEYEQLRKTLNSQPTVAALLQAQADLVSLCQAAGDLLSETTGLNFGSSACASGCCG